MRRHNARLSSEAPIGGNLAPARPRLLKISTGWLVVEKGASCHKWTFVLLCSLGMEKTFFQCSPHKRSLDSIQPFFGKCLFLGDQRLQNVDQFNLQTSTVLLGGDSLLLSCNMFRQACRQSTRKEEFHQSCSILICTENSGDPLCNRTGNLGTGWLHFTFLRS